MPQVEMPCVLIHAEVREERTDPKTGQVYDAQGVLSLLTSERGVPAIVEVKCSPAAAKRFSPDGIRVGEPVKTTSLLIDMSEYNVNGNKGVSRKLVEAGSETKNRGTFSMATPKPASERPPETRQAPPAQMGTPRPVGATG